MNSVYIISHRSKKRNGRFPDGGSIYGLLFHRLGAAVAPLGNEDDNFYGPNSGNIWLENIIIKDLIGNPRMVPFFTSATGKPCKGTNEEVIPILDFLDDHGSGRLWGSPSTSYYRGNFLLDAYVAQLVLSSRFYRRTIFDSACGNFISNFTGIEFGQEENCKATLNPTNAPLKGEFGSQPGINNGPNAFLSSNRHYSYNGRDSLMLQKKY